MERSPVVLVGHDKEWKGLERWTFEKLIPRFDNDAKWRASLPNDDFDEAVPWKSIVNLMTSINVENWGVRTDYSHNTQRAMHLEQRVKYHQDTNDELHEAPQMKNYVSHQVSQYGRINA